MQEAPKPSFPNSQIRAMGFSEVVHSEVLIRKIVPRKLATCTDLLFPMGKKCDCAENLPACSFLLSLLGYFLFWRVGGDKPEMKHFILVSLTWLGNISFFWLDWFQINSEYASASLRESAALFIYYGCAFRRTSKPRRQRASFVLAESMGIV